MKIVVAGAFPPQQKGEAHYLGQYARALRAAGSNDISVLSQYNVAPGVEVVDGFTVRRAIQDRSQSGMSYAPQEELVRSALDVRPDVLHVHYGPGPDYGGRLGETLVPALRRIRAANIRTVLTLHSVWLPADVRDQATRLRAPGLIHSGIVWYFGHFMRRLRGAVDRLLLLVSASPSPVSAAFAQAYGVPDLGEEVHASIPRLTPYKPATEPEMLAFGFLRPDKGFDGLIDAFGAHVEAGGRGRLRIVGRPQGRSDEAYAAALVARAARYAGRITVDVRYVPDDELELLLRGADVIVVPYLRNVGASGPLHHALGVGRAVLCSDAGHNAAFRGVLETFHAGDTQDLREKIAVVMNDDGRRVELAARSADIAEKRSFESLAAAHLALYESLLKA